MLLKDLLAANNETLAESNLNTGPGNRAWVTHTVVTLCLTLSVLVVVCRIWSRYFILHRMGLDDWLAILSLLAVVGEGVSMLYEVDYGMGRHIGTLNATDLWKFQRSFYVTVVVYTAALLFLKMTFLVQYYRVLAVQEMWKWYIAAMVIVGLWATSQLLVSIMLCIPIRGFWDASVKASCIPTYPQVYINASGNVITDVMILILPLPAIWRLNVPSGQKRALLCIFSLGFLTVAISIVRFQYLKASSDVTWTNVVGSSWSLAELACALICACLPTLKPVLSQCLPFLRSQITRKTPSESPSSSRRIFKFPRSTGTNITGTTACNTFATMDTITMDNINTVNPTPNQSTDDLHYGSQLKSQGLPIMPNSKELLWAYIPDEKLGTTGEAQVLKIQHDLGLASTSEIQVASVENKGSIPQNGTIRIDTEVIVMANKD
ncbi:hypothetical protein BROUX41_002327 [Berkeleyomyces rouxiae]|uniref:uncharacterized protein n=1 Tax=Berkeleyomyces rouxiae TaxID=2035830 RepID=UPI003B7D7BDD